MPADEGYQIYTPEAESTPLKTNTTNKDKLKKGLAASDETKSWKMRDPIPEEFDLMIEAQSEPSEWEKDIDDCLDDQFVDWPDEFS